jgi:hypothetical protein
VEKSKNKKQITIIKRNEKIKGSKKSKNKEVWGRGKSYRLSKSLLKIATSWPSG